MIIIPRTNAKVRLVMTQYIDKTALVAEIKRRIKQFVKENNTLLKNSDNAKELRSRIIMCKEVLSFLDTLEVKEIDLEKEYKNFIKSDNGRSMFETAEHFFKLGLKASNPITTADRGIVNEIIFALNSLGEEKMISYDKEIEWVMSKVKEGE